jgi:hypothetical protein
MSGRHRWKQYIIREHGYCFQRCDCGAYRGGERVRDEVTRLLATKVRPTVRRV